MGDFFKTIFSNEVTFVLVAEIFLFFLILFVFLYMIKKSNEKDRIKIKIDMIASQNEVFSNAAELLAQKLLAYTDGVLVEKVNDYYITLVSKDLLPSVNAAAKKIEELSVAVTQRQEDGIKALAVMLAELLAEKTNEYVKQEAEIIASIQDKTAVFSNELSRITDNVKELSSLYLNAHEHSNNMSSSVLEVVLVISNKILEFEKIMDTTTASIAQMQSSITQGSQIIATFNQASNQAQKLVIESTSKIAQQNEDTATIINNAVNSMQQNTELATKAVLSEFNTNLNSTTETIEGTVITLKDITENIKTSASQFSDGISNVYKNFGDDIDKNLNNVKSSITDSVSAEYKKLTMSAEAYSNNFIDNIANLNSTLGGHINNLETITNQLNKNVASFNDDVDTSASRFELGMEKTVSDALTQMDNSLAEIVKRLVSVTKNIKETSDALPRAVKAVNEFK